MKLQFTSSLIILCLLLLTLVSQAQVLNDTEINYQVRLLGVSFEGNLDASAEEPTWIYKVKGSQNSNVINGPFPVCDAFITPDMCYYYVQEHSSGGSSRLPIPVSISTNNHDINTITPPRIGVTDTYFEIEETSFERDVANTTFCTYQCGDDRLTFTEKSYNIKSQGQATASPITLTQTFLNGAPTGTNTTIEYAWRYKNGDNINNALDFGDLSTISKSHTNSIREAPEGFDSSMGYSSNAFNLTTTSDGIWYKFIIPTDGRNVGISQTSGNTLISNIFNEDEERLLLKVLLEPTSVNLCEGIYYIRIDRLSATEGVDLNLTLTPSPIDITPGNIVATTVAVCSGEEIPRIINSSLASVEGSLAGAIDYQWEKSTNDGLVFTPISGATGASIETLDCKFSNSQSARILLAKSMAGFQTPATFIAFVFH